MKQVLGIKISHRSLSSLSSSKALLFLYFTYVRPQLEYASSVWCPYAKSHINMIENVKRRATKLTHSLRNLDYKRLARLGLTTIVDRRKRGDVIQIFKIIFGQNIVNWQVYIQVYQCLRENGPANNLRLTRKLNCIVDSAPNFLHSSHSRL